VRIGARTRHRDVESATELRGTLDVLLDAAPLISDPLIRNMGTVGGSVCHADPAGDWGAVMLAVGAEFVVKSAGGERVLPAAGFFEGPFTTGLHADEVMTEIRIPVGSGRSGGTYLKLERKVGDFASVAAAVHVVLGDDGRIATAGIGLCAVGAHSIKATAAEAALAGQEPTDAVIAEAARLAGEAAEPKADIRGSAEYKRDVARVFVQRGLHTAINRAQGAAA
jgi:carbon-monoxide dehydrogenase medium subunit